MSVTSVAVPEIAGEIDRGHAAAAELALEQVAVGQGGLEPFESLGQRGIRFGMSQAYSHGCL